MLSRAERSLILDIKLDCCGCLGDSVEEIHGFAYSVCTYRVHLILLLPEKCPPKGLPRREILHAAVE